MISTVFDLTSKTTPYPQVPWGDDSGLVLEVADSLVAPGKGLFVRLEEGVSPLQVPTATPLCGYASGTMDRTPGSGDKTVRSITNACMPTFSQIAQPKN